MQEFHGKIQAMQYTNKYSSPLGEMLMAADDTGLTGLWFMGQKYFALYLDREHKEKDLPVFRDTKHWLDIYFSGKEPNFKLPLHFTGSPFQNEVWKILYSNLCLSWVNFKMFVYEHITKGNFSAHPHSFFTRGGNLIANTFGPDFSFKLGKRQ